MHRLAFVKTVTAAALSFGCASAPAVVLEENGAAVATSRPAVIAHRGASYAAPEHTFAAYDLALSQGADYIEQDVQRTADGVLVVLHDLTLDRTARGSAENCTGPVAGKTLAQVKTCDAGSWFNAANPLLARAEYGGTRIPTLREVLGRYSARARFYIEIKDPEQYPGIEEDLLKTLRDAGVTPGGTVGRPTVYLQSFSAITLQRIKAVAPAWPLVQLIGRENSGNISSMLGLIREYAVGIGPQKASVTPELVEAAHGSCLLVHPYTVDDPAEMSALLALGVDGIFTNRTDLALNAANSRVVRYPPRQCDR